MNNYSKFHLKKFQPRKFFGTVIKTKDIFYYLKNGKKIMDTTSGWTSHATLGFNNPDILRAVKKQMKKFFHVDYNVWHNLKLISFQTFCRKMLVETIIRSISQDVQGASLLKLHLNLVIKLTIILGL